ncbi:MAG: hypothetical protein AB4372_15610 [Xenococcus sp. (in: cyanobacteria)]
MFQSKNQSYQEEIRQLKTELKNKKIDHENDKNFLVMFEEENKKIEIENKKIIQYNDDLIFQLSEKTREVELLKHKYQDFNDERYDLLEKIKIYQKPEIKSLDLSSKSLAFIGGDQEVTKNIIQDLNNDFNPKRVIVIPPKWESNKSLSDIKLQVRNMDFIVYFTRQNSHCYQNIFNQIKHKISGKIIYVNTKGYSSGLREILEYLGSLL